MARQAVAKGVDDLKVRERKVRVQSETFEDALALW